MKKKTLIVDNSKNFHEEFNNLFSTEGMGSRGLVPITFLLSPNDKKRLLHFTRKRKVPASQALRNMVRLFLDSDL